MENSAIFIAIIPNGGMNYVKGMKSDPIGGTINAGIYLGFRYALLTRGKPVCTKQAQSMPEYLGIYNHVIAYMSGC